MAVNGKGRTYCEAQVHNDIGVNFHTCGKTARYEYHGQTYCKTHHPPSAAKRRLEAPKCAAAGCDVIVRGTDLCAIHRSLRRLHAPFEALEKANRRIKVLEAALAPFAKFGDYMVKHQRNGVGNNLYSWDHKVFLRQRDLKRAYEVLNSK